MNFRHGAAIVCIILFTCACKKNPQAENVFVRAEKSTVTFKGSELQTDTIHITSNGAWQVLINDDAHWLSVNPLSGTGNADLVLSSTMLNSSFARRSSLIEVKPVSGNNSAVITVLQLQSADSLLRATFGGEGDDLLVDFTTTPDGGYIAVGSTTSQEGDASMANGLSDLWIVKFNSQGEKMWHRLYGGYSYDFGYAIVRTPENNYLILGLTDSNNGDVGAHKGAMDAWLLSIDNSGNLLWEKTIGGSNDDELLSLKPAGNGQYLMAGFTFSSDYDVSSLHGNADAWLVKVDAQGTIVWEKTFGGTDFDFARDASPVSDGGIIFCGNLRSTDGDAADHNAVNSAWLAKINAAGNIAGKVYLGNAEGDVAVKALEASNGDYLFAGESISQSEFEDAHGSTDVFVCRLDAAGNYLWKRAYGGTGADTFTDFIETADGHFIFSGATKSNDGDIPGNHGLTDGWVSKLDAEGHIISSIVTGKSKSDEIRRVKELTANKYAFLARSEELEDAYPELLNNQTAWFQVFSF